MVLFLHNRYRSTGGEERAVAELMALVRDELGEPAELLERDSAAIGRGRAAAALLRGGLAPEEVAAAVRRTGARVVHAHNLNPAFGPRALTAARAAGARVVLHLHNYRLVCAVGTCIDARGEDCVRCQGANTAPGVRLNCRGSRPESAAYAAALSLHARRLVAAADVVVVPSAAAERRLRELRAPVGAVHVVPHVVREPPALAPRERVHALVASRLAREKDVDTAVRACELAGVPLVVAGDGPEGSRLRDAYPAVRFAGLVADAELAQLRASALVALVPSKAHETYGLSALEAMAAGVPVVASRVGALAELEGDAELVAPGDAGGMAAAIARVLADPAARDRALAAARRRAAPSVVAPLLAAAYDG